MLRPYVGRCYATDCFAVADANRAGGGAHANIVGKLAVIELSADDYQSVLRLAAKPGLASGTIYDALHMHCARKAAADQILTYNVSHFERFQLPGIAVTVP